ncbi:response regulator transcription factor [Bacillus sp. AK128]
MRKNILVVDDESITLQGLKKTLEGWANSNKEILIAPNAASAIELFHTKKIHLLITDIDMPEMTGLEMLKEVRSKGQLPVVIVISAHSDFKYAQEAIELGVVHYLLKPINKQKLIDVVEKALEIEDKRIRVSIIEKVVDDQLIHIKEDEQIDGPIEKAIKYVDSNLSNPINLKEVAGHVHLNPSYFSVLFKEQTNMTFSEYITRSRIQKAKNLLLTTNLSVNEIAEKVGYNTPKYFIKIFKEYENVTPSRYKRK